MFERAVASRLGAVVLAIGSMTSFAQSSTSAQLTISAATTDFVLGEVIRLDLAFTATEPNRFLADSRQYDRVGRLNFLEQFVVEPEDGAEDPLAGLPSGQGGMGGISGGPLVLAEKPFVLQRVLNDYVRFRRPGQFRIHVVSRRVTEVDDARQLDDARRFAAKGKPVELVSNVLTLSIRPASAAWIGQQIAEARAALAQPFPPPNNEIAAERQRAIAILRALGTADAAMELARPAADDTSFAAQVTILGSPHRKELLARLEQRLAAPDQAVSDSLIDTLAQLAVVAESGPMPEYPKGPEQQKSWQAEAKRRSDLQSQKRDEYVLRLIPSLRSKQPDARAVSLHALLALAMRTGRAPGWIGEVAADLARDFRHLPASIQAQLLESYWGLVRSPALLPVLRELLDSRQLRDTALRRIYELAPDEGRNFILDEIREPKGRFEFSSLAILPDASLPELDEVLVQHMDPLRIARYASGSVVKRVEGAYLAQQGPRFCVGPLAFYFLKFDPPFGERLLRAEFAKPDLPPACYDLNFQFLSLGRSAYSPALERLAIESLTSDKVPVKRGAAELLGKYGSVAARKSLWDAMEYFRSWWKGREAQLNERIGEESRQLELALRNALGKADAWVLTDAELRRLLELCSSESCRNDVTSWSASRASPVNIQAYGSGIDLRFLVGDYGQGDAAWLARKLSQFAPGVMFRILAPTMPVDARERVEEAVRAAGHVVAPEPGR